MKQKIVSVPGSGYSVHREEKNGVYELYRVVRADINCFEIMHIKNDTVNGSWSINRWGAYPTEWQAVVALNEKLGIRENEI